MTTLRRTTIWVFAIAGMLGLCLAAGEAQATQVYSDDFAADHDGWTYMDVSDGQECNWTITAGVLQEQSNAADGVFISGYSSDSTDYTITVKALSTGASDSGMGIVFGYTDAQNYWQFTWSPTSGARELSQYVSGAKNVRDSDTAAVTSSTWYTMEVDVAGAAITCKIDTVTKLTYSAVPALNYNGLHTYDNDDGVQYDDYAIDETDTSGDGPSKASDGNYHISEYWQYIDSTSTTYATLETLQFTPASTDEHWVVVVSWRTKDTAGDTESRKVGRARILVNSAVRTGADAIGHEDYGTHWKAFGLFFKITGTTAQQTIELQRAADDNTDRWDRARIMAFKIPNPNEADIQYFEDLGPDENLAQTDYNFTFTPSSAGDYIIMASATGHEGPGGARAATLMQFIDHASVTQSETDESWFSSTMPYVSLFHVQKASLTAVSTTFKIRHNPDTTNKSTIRHVCMLAFRADVFANVQYASSTTDSNTTLTSWQNYLTLSPAGTTTPRDNVYLTGFCTAPYGTGQDANSRITFDYSTYMFESPDERACSMTMGMGYADTSTGDKRISLEYKATSGETAQVLGGYILALTYPSGNTAESPYCEAAATPITNVTDTTPEFSAVYNDAGTSMTATYYEIEVDTKSAFDGKRMWDTGKTAMTALADNTRSTDVSYAGTTLALNGITYYWRIRFWDDSGGVGLWSATQQFTMQCATGGYTWEWGENSNCEFQGTCEDGYLDEYWTNNHFGSAILMRVGQDQAALDRANRGLIKFNLDALRDLISSEDQITSASLKVMTYDDPDPGNVTAEAFRINKEWTAGPASSTANDDDDEVSWTYQKYDETAWTAAGCDDSTDRQTTADDSQIFALDNTWYTYTVTNSVKNMFTNSTDYGWILKSTEESILKYWRIHSSENGTAANRPYLSITFNASNPPLPPQTPYCNDDNAQSGATNPTGITDTTPAFSAIYDDANTSDTAAYYELQVGDDDDFSNIESDYMWKSTKISMTSTNENARCPDITYAGTALSDATYYWRVRFWDNTGARGEWSATQQFSFTSNTTPSAPAIALLFDNEKVTATPAFKFTGTDAQSDDLDYQIRWDTDINFGTATTKSSSDYPTDAGWTAATFSSAAQVTYTVQSALTNGTTYWWQVQTRDPAGTNTWSGWTTARSFTIDTSLTAPAWHQTTKEQFDNDVAAGTVAPQDGTDDVRMDGP